MSQNDFTLANQSGPGIRADMNLALQALASMSSGPVAPTVSYPGQMFMLTTGASPDVPVAIQVREYNTATWHTIFKWNAASAQWQPNTNVIQALTTAGITFKNAAGATIGALSDAGALTIPGALSAASVPLPARLGPTYQGTSDWNGATDTGFYAGLSAANAPSTNWFLGYVVSQSASWIVQEVFSFANNSDPGGDLFYYRREKNNGVWGAWERVYKNKFEIDALIDAKIAATSGPITTALTQVPAAGVTSTVAHGAGSSTKYNVSYFIRCHTAHTAGTAFAVGDTFPVMNYVYSGYGQRVKIDTANVEFTSGSVTLLMPGTNGADYNMDETKWDWYAVVEVVA